MKRSRVVVQVTGEAGKSYGLQAPREVPNVFRQAETENEHGESERERQLKRQETAALAAANEQAKLRSENPNIYEYDSLYDTFHSSGSGGDQKQKAKAAEERKPQYMGALQQMAAKRQRFLDIAFDRKIAKEAEREKAEFGETEAFVTASWKRKLAEDRKWEEDDERRDVEEGINDADETLRRRGFTGLSEFHSHLLNDITASSEEKKQETKQKQKQKQSQPIPDDASKPIQQTSTNTPKASTTSTSTKLRSVEEEEEEEKKEAEAEIARKRKRKQELEEQYKKAMEEREKSKDQKKQASDAKLARHTDDRNELSARERFLARKAAMQAELEAARAKAADEFSSSTS